MNGTARLSHAAVLIVSLASTLLLLSTLPGRVVAQPNLNFKRVIKNWPTIEMYFSVACNGKPAYFTDPSYFRVFENGVPKPTFTMWCPDVAVPCPLSVSLVFDASSSMNAGSALTGAKSAGHQFADALDGVADQAGILTFNDTVTTLQAVTTNKTSLHAAINGMVATGGSRVWDGAYAGVNMVVTGGTNVCRAVILLADGADNGSTYTPLNVIALANQNRIRVFTIGLGTGIDAALLQAVADQTGGRYYQTPSGAELTLIYQEIQTIMFQGFQECMITYQAECADGAVRTVDLQLLNFCGGNDSKTKIYTAPRDTAQYASVQIAVGRDTVEGGGQTLLPVSLVSSYQGELGPISVDVLFDPAWATLLAVRTQGTPLDGTAVSFTAIPGGYRITSQQKATVSGPGPLFQLELRASDPAGSSVICYPLGLQNWIFTAGCVTANIQPGGQLCIRPRQATLSCEMTAPHTLDWERTRKDYDPNPFLVRTVVRNDGTRTATNARFRITVSDTTVQLVSPVFSEQAGTPRNVDVNGLSAAEWQLRAIPRLVGDSVEVCIRASFDDAGPVTCCSRIWIAPTVASLVCSASADVITMDRTQRTYTPMPFTVTATVSNEGGRASDSVTVRIVLPPGELALAGTDAPDRFRKLLQPAILASTRSGSARFTLTHPVTGTERRYTVGFWVYDGGQDSTWCETTVIVPAFDAPFLAAVCTMPDSLRVDPGSGAYLPTPVRVTLAVSNAGGAAARGGRYVISYPPGSFTLVNAADSIQSSYPLDVAPQGSASVAWNICALPRSTADSVTVTVTGVFDNAPPVQCTRRIWIPRGNADVSCALTIPTITARLGEQRYEPMPFTVTVPVTNRGSVATDTVRVRLALTGDLRLAAPDDSIGPVKTTVPPILGPGASTTVTFVLTHPVSPVEKQPAITATVQNGTSTSGQCAGSVTIPVLLVPITPTISADGPLQFCTGDSVLLDAGPGYRSYMWTSGDTTRTLRVHTAGSYAVAVTTTDGRMAVSAPVVVTVLPRPRPVLAAGDSQVMCAGDSLVLDAGPTMQSYLWSTGDTSRRLTVRAPGRYWVQVTSQDGCTGRSDSLHVLVEPRPPVPTVIQSGNVLLTQQGDAYQWYRDSIPLPGATDQYLVPDVTGWYSVGIISAAGCETRSLPLYVTVLDASGPAHVAHWSIAVHPDPVRDQVTITVREGRGGALTLRVLDATGRQVGQDLRLDAAAQGSVTLSMHGASAGTYFVVGTDGSAPRVVKFIKL